MGGGEGWAGELEFVSEVKRLRRVSKERIAALAEVAIGPALHARRYKVVASVLLKTAMRSKSWTGRVAAVCLIDAVARKSVKVYGVHDVYIARFNASLVDSLVAACYGEGTDPEKDSKMSQDTAIGIIRKVFRGWEQRGTFAEEHLAKCRQNVSELSDTNGKSDEKKQRSEDAKRPSTGSGKQPASDSANGKSGRKDSGDSKAKGQPDERAESDKDLLASKTTPEIQAGGSSVSDIASLETVVDGDGIASAQPGAAYAPEDGTHPSRARRRRSRWEPAVVPIANDELTGSLSQSEPPTQTRSIPIKKAKLDSHQDVPNQEFANPSEKRADAEYDPFDM